MEREATVKLTLDNSQFLVSIRRSGDAIAEETKRATRESSRWGDGLNKAKDTLKSMGGDLMNLTKMAVTFGGALSTGAMVQHVVGLETSYKNLAFSIQRATGSQADWKQLMRDGEAIADKWKRSNDEIADSFGEIFKTTEDLGFTKEAVDAVGMAANATGADVKAMTSIASELGEKFGSTTATIKDDMAVIVGMVPGGKKGLEELGDSLGLLGASARAAGMEGQDGLKKALGMLNMAGASGGNFKKELMSVVQLFEQLGDQDQVKNIEKQLTAATNFQRQVKLRDKDGKTRSDVLEVIMKETGGKHENLSKIFSGPLLRFMSELGKSFDKDFESFEGNRKQKADHALEEFRKRLDSASQSTMTRGKLEEEAIRRTKEDPERKLQDALNKLHHAFSKPEALKAIDDLADALPKLASVISKFVSFAINNPVMAGAGFVGGRALLGFAGGAISSGGGIGGMLGKVGEKAVGDAVGTAIKSAAGTAGMSFAKTAFASAGIIGAAGLLAVGIMEAVDEYRENERRQRKQDVIDAGTRAEEAAARGETLSPEQAKAIEEKMLVQTPLALGGDTEGLDKKRARDEKAGFAAQATFGKSNLFGDQQSHLFDPKQGDRLMDLVREPVLGPLSIEQQNMPRAQAEKAKPDTTPRAVKIENEDSMSKSFARALSMTTLKVEVKGNGFDASRGPLILPPPRGGS